LLAPIHGFHRIAKLRPAARLYLDERYQSLALDDEIDVAVTAPKSALNHAPTLAPEPPLRDPLAKLAEPLLGR
jgi:hypothetical protein